MVRRLALDQKIPGSSPGSPAMWRVRLVVRTQDSHSCNTGSTPVHAAKLLEGILAIIVIVGGKNF